MFEFFFLKKSQMFKISQFVRKANKIYLKKFHLVILSCERFYTYYFISRLYYTCVTGKPPLCAKEIILFAFVNYSMERIAKTKNQLLDKTVELIVKQFYINIV